MSTAQPCRSALYLPASNLRAITKARRLEVDAVILDLEDAVAPEEKARARTQLVEALQQGGFGHRTLVVRINHPSTEWGREDLQAVAAAKPHALLLPKVGSPGDVVRAVSALSLAGNTETRIWIMVETPTAIGEIAHLAAAASDRETRLDTLVMGTNDLANEARMALKPGRAPLLPALATCVMAARRWGLAILDGVYNRLDDPEGFADECAQGRDFGFDGKTLIHPDQIVACNAAFSPSMDEIDWARQVVTAFSDAANAGKGVLRVAGRMVERLDLAAAARILAVETAISARNKAGPDHVGSGL